MIIKLIIRGRVLELPGVLRSVFQNEYFSVDFKHPDLAREAAKKLTDSGMGQFTAYGQQVLIPVEMATGLNIGTPIHCFDKKRRNRTRARTRRMQRAAEEVTARQAEEPWARTAGPRWIEAAPQPPPRPAPPPLAPREGDGVLIQQEIARMQERLLGEGPFVVTERVHPGPPGQI